MTHITYSNVVIESEEEDDVSLLVPAKNVTDTRVEIMESHERRFSIFMTVVVSILFGFVLVHIVYFKLQETRKILLVSDTNVDVQWERFAIIGAAWHLPFASSVVFVKSARRFCLNCSIVLFVDANNKDDVSVSRLQFFTHYNVTIVKHSFTVDTNSLTVPNGINDLRYTWYVDYFRTREHEFDALFHADVKDTVFQGNVFDELVTKYRVHQRRQDLVWGFEESHFQTIGTERSHIGWMKECFGEDTFQRMKDMYAICSGSILGTTSAILRHFDAIVKKSESSKCRGIVDQASHILLIRDTPLPGIQYIVESNEHGYKIGTLGMLNQKPGQIGHVTKDSVTYDTFGNVANDDGVMYLVLHQYYIIPGLDEKFSRLYSVDKV